MLTCLPKGLQGQPVPPASRSFPLNVRHPPHLCPGRTAARAGGSRSALPVRGRGRGCKAYSRGVTASFPSPRPSERRQPPNNVLLFKFTHPRCLHLVNPTGAQVLASRREPVTHPYHCPPTHSCSVRQWPLHFAISQILKILKKKKSKSLSDWARACNFLFCKERALKEKTGKEHLP